MPYLKVNGVSIYYEEAGEGKAVVFMHGLLGSTLDWAAQTDFLSPKYQVIALDQRGHGKSEASAVGDEYLISLFADDLYKILDQLGIERCCLVGHSMGGFVAIQFAVEHQEKLFGLVLVDTSSEDFDRLPEELENSRRLHEMARSQGMEAIFQFQVANNPRVKEVVASHPDILERTHKKMMMTSVDGFIYCTQAIDNRESLTSRLDAIKVPTLIIRGAEDKQFTRAVQVLREGIPGSELVIIPGANHSPHEEKPDEFNMVLDKFLKKIYG